MYGYRPRRALPAAALLLIALSACAQVEPGGTGAGNPPDDRSAAFEQRASQVAEAWRAGAPGRPAWRTGYVPLQEPTVLPADPEFTDDTRQAFQAGWYRAGIELPTRAPDPEAVIRFPDGTLTVPVIGADEAYRQIDQGDPPPCPGRPTTPPPTGPDGSVSGPEGGCIPLTVTAAKFGTVSVHTSRGPAQVPAWLFTIEELAAPVARVAVHQDAVTPAPTGSPPAQPPAAEIVAATDLSEVDGPTLHYRVGVGACDKDIVPLVQQYADVIILGAGVTRAAEVCTDQLLLAPTTVTLEEPLGSRPVLDVLTGEPLRLVATG